MLSHQMGNTLLIIEPTCFKQKKTQVDYSTDEQYFCLKQHILHPGKYSSSKL